VKIAVLDSGIETSHPELATLALTDDLAIIDDGLQLQIQPGEATDAYGHGTAVASILHRLAPRASIGSFRVLGPNLSSRTVIIREGVRQAMDRGYHILNCSFGCGLESHLPQYKSWVDEAYLAGIHVIAACNNADFTRPEFPGYFPSVITVNFCGERDGGTFFYKPGHLVEFAAPGESLEVAWAEGARKTVTGSSFAAPHVAAILARLLSVYPDLPPLQAKALLHQLARPWTSEKRA
jgi:subtilisin family serine protease